MKSKDWAAVLAVILVVCLGLSVYYLKPGQQARWAEIWSDGKLVETVYLGTDRELTIEGINGTNVVSVREGKLAVTQADCPDHYCMDRGFCSGGAQIVCLPNRLVVRFVGEQGLDGVVG